jgi:two-component system, chemotaxis family, sensor kinase CheA
VAQDPYKYFRIEARELLEQLSRGVLDLEKSGATEGLVARLLRAAHTLKGAARVVKQIEIAEQAHGIEDLLIPFRDSTTSLPREQIERLLGILDQINGRLAPISQPIQSAEATTAARTPLPEPAARTVRADVVALDALLDGLAETHVQIGSMRKHLALLEQAGHRVNLLADQKAVAQARSIAQELRTLFAGLERGLAGSLDRMDRELQEVRDAAEQLRLVSAGSLFTALERSARDAAELLGKSVSFESAGEQVRLDAQVLDVVQGALHQLVRNAVAHGVELPSIRAASGKTEAGSIRLAVVRAGRRVVFRCQDDGAGMDLESVRRTASRRGLLPDTAQAMDVESLLRTLLRGGISTAGVVSQVAGRGIGLDVVRAAAETLGGEVNVTTVVGQGTTVELSVPASVAAIEALVVQAGGVTAAIPLDSVRQTIRVEDSSIARSVSGESVLHAGRVVPFVPLARLLNRVPDTRRSGRAWSIIIVQGADGQAAIGVERLCGTSGIVLRSLPRLAPPLTLLSGASLDAEGNAQMVLDPEGLIRAALSTGAATAPPPTSRLPVLIVDDSLTTRMLEQSILESAGFEVDMAMSGEEALEAAARKRYALFLVDVEMPGMDGFTFIERYRLDSTLRDIPAILVTSRCTPDDLRRGDAVGARGYMVKSEFNQAVLLERIRELVH